MKSLGWAVCVAIALGCVPLWSQDESAGFEVTSWFHADVELRARGQLESFLNDGDDQSSTATLGRIRLNAALSPRQWLRLTLRLQDARTITGPVGRLAELHDNHAGALDAFADVGYGDEGGWNVRVGRQPLAFGDERLVGADSYWCNRSQRFDGIRGTIRRNVWQWDLFSAAPVEILPNRPDPINRTERLSGVYGRWSSESAAVVEPYVIWKRSRNSGERYDILTPGWRGEASLPGRFQVVTEMALQQGRSSGAPIAAWAGYWELGRQLGESERSPRVAVSYSYATGQKDPLKRGIGTFNDLHPAGYNGCGFLEPFAWRNIRDLSTGSELPLPAHWQLTTEFHRYWLATENDGVYVDGGPYVAINPLATSSLLGARILASGQRAFGAHHELALGYARFFPASYMKDSVSLHHSAFISWTLRL